MLEKTNQEAECNLPGLRQMKLQTSTLHRIAHEGRQSSTISPVHSQTAFRNRAAARWCLCPSQTATPFTLHQKAQLPLVFQWNLVDRQTGAM